MMSYRQAFMEEKVRKVITDQVLEEIMKKEIAVYEDWKVERQERLEEEEKNRFIILGQLTKQYPLYATQAQTIYVMKYGRGKVHPFRKDTTFTKPVTEDLNHQFK